MSSGTCTACGRAIDAAAKTCPYCGADPVTGERLDTQSLLQEVFRPKEMTTSESVMQYARQRQGIVVVMSIIAAFLVLAGLHQFVTMRNATAVTDAPAVPLTEITDVANQKDEAAPRPMPALDFPYDGRPQAMRTFIVEGGAIAPMAPAPAAGPTATSPAAPAPDAAGAAAAMQPSRRAAQARLPQQAPPPPPHR